MKLRVAKNIFDNLQPPRLFLCTPGKKIIGEIHANNVELDANWNSYSELKFNVDRTYINIITGDTDEDVLFNKLEGLRKVLVENIGYFVIQDPSTEYGDKDNKELSCFSVEYETASKYLENFKINTGDVDSAEVMYLAEQYGDNYTIDTKYIVAPRIFDAYEKYYIRKYTDNNTYIYQQVVIFDNNEFRNYEEQLYIEKYPNVRFYWPSKPELSLLNIIFDKIPEWSIGHVDTSLKNLERKFDSQRIAVYDFLMNDLFDSCRCVIEWDTLNYQVNFYEEVNDDLLNNTIEEDNIDNLHIGRLVAQTAASYLLARDIYDDGIISEQDKMFCYAQTNLFSDTNGIQKITDSYGRFRLDCSAFLGLVLRGISFNNSPFAIYNSSSHTRYANKTWNPNSNWNSSKRQLNICGNYGWEYTFLDAFPVDSGYNNIGINGYRTLRFAADIAKYFVENERDRQIIFDASRDANFLKFDYNYNLAKYKGVFLCEYLQPGDLIFWSKSSATDIQKSRWKSISHAAVVAENTNKYYQVTNKANSYNQEVDVWDGGVYYSTLDERHIKEITYIIRPNYRLRCGDKKPTNINLLNYPPRWSSLLYSTYKDVTYEIVNDKRMKLTGTKLAGTYSTRYIRNHNTTEKEQAQDNFLRLIPGKYTVCLKKISGSVTTILTSGKVVNNYKGTGVVLHVTKVNGDDITKSDNGRARSIEDQVCNFEINEITDVRVSIYIGTNQYQFLNYIIEPEIKLIEAFADNQEAISLKNFDSDIYVSRDNLTSRINVKYSTDDIRTKIKISGNDDANIREVNLGRNYLMNLDFYNNSDWMSDDLIEAYNNYSRTVEWYNSLYLAANNDWVLVNKQYNDLMNAIPIDKNVLLINDPFTQLYCIYPLYSYVKSYNSGKTYYIKNSNFQYIQADPQPTSNGDMTNDVYYLQNDFTTAKNALIAMLNRYHVKDDTSGNNPDNVLLRLTNSNSDLVTIIIYNSGTESSPLYKIKITTIYADEGITGSPIEFTIDNWINGVITIKNSQLTRLSDYKISYIGTMGAYLCLSKDETQVSNLEDYGIRLLEEKEKVYTTIFQTQTESMFSQEGYQCLVSDTEPEDVAIGTIWLNPYAPNTVSTTALNKYTDDGWIGFTNDELTKYEMYSTYKDNYDKLMAVKTVLSEKRKFIEYYNKGFLINEQKIPLHTKENIVLHSIFNSYDSRIELKNFVKIWRLFNDGIVTAADRNNIHSQTIKDEFTTLANEYNNLINGNLDYNKRPMVTSEKMKQKYIDFPENTYSVAYPQLISVGSDSNTFTVLIASTNNSGTVFGYDDLLEYVTNLKRNGTTDDFLLSDDQKLIINVQKGTYNESYWTSLQNSLSDIEQDFVDVLVDYMEVENMLKDMFNSTTDYNAFINNLSSDYDLDMSDIENYFTKKDLSIIPSLLRVMLMNYLQDPDITTNSFDDNIMVYYFLSPNKFPDQKMAVYLDSDGAPYVVFANSMQIAQIKKNHYIQQSEMSLFFTATQWRELSPFIREDELNDSNFLFTGYESEEERLSIYNEFVEYAKKKIKVMSQPTLEFSADLSNILFLSEFTNLINNFELGNFIRVELRPELVKKVRLLNIHISFNDLDSLSCDFGNLINNKNQIQTHAELLKQAVTAGKTVTASSAGWQRNIQQTQNIEESLNNGLQDVALEVGKSHGQNIIWDEYGIWGRKLIEGTVDQYDDEQFRIINNKLLFSNDGFETSKAVMGKFTIKDENGNDVEHWGVLSDAVISGYIKGTTIEGGSMSIGEGNTKFVVNSDGSVSITENGIPKYAESTEISSLTNSLRYSIKIEYSGSTIFRTSNASCILTCKIYDLLIDKTAEKISQGATFSWIRKSDGDDTSWNNSHANFGNVITIQPSDVVGNAQFSCQVTFTE